MVTIAAYPPCVAVDPEGFGIATLGAYKEFVFHAMNHSTRVCTGGGEDAV